MFGLKTKNEELIEALASELEETREKLQVEERFRVAAEALVQELRKRADFAEQMAKKSDEERRSIQVQRIESLDKVNLALMSVASPEKPPIDIKNFTPIPKKRRQMTGEINRLVDIMLPLPVGKIAPKQAAIKLEELRPVDSQS